MPQPIQGLALSILTGILMINTLYKIRRQLEDDLEVDPEDKLEDELDYPTDEDVPSSEPESEEYWKAEEYLPSSPRPQLRRRNCFFWGPDGLIEQPMPCKLGSDSSSFISQSEESESEGEQDAAPFRSLAEIEIEQYFAERLRSHRESPRSPRYSTISSQEALNAEHLTERLEAEKCEQDDTEDVKNRNIRMREQGVPVSVSYSQLSSLTTTTPALPRMSAPTTVTNVAPAIHQSTVRDSRPKAPSPPSSGTSTTSSSIQPSTPAPTPCDPATGITTPDHHGPFTAPQQPTAMLPTSGRRAQPVLDAIDEKLLAIPADAVSRRLLRDGRALLRRGGRLAKRISFASRKSIRQLDSAEGNSPAGSGGSGASYPSDMME
ncbi:hypothetical protein diail_3844 [Diaporthe ilicicola]|nr:hypothetical protein diail_3844 [Diaporthe ilicicola]